MMLNIPGSSKSEKLELLIEIARAYYEQGHDQDMIAQSMGISRSQVSRYLTQARELNLVQIRVVSPQDRMGLLEHEISEKFPNLKEAVVVPAFKTSQDILRKTIGRVAAAYFAQLIIPGMNICLGSGRTLREVVYYLRPNQIPNISIIQAMGNVGHEAMQIDFNDIARETARAFSARVIYLNSPAILGSGNVNELVRDNPTINQALQIARAADIFLFGVGSPRGVAGLAAGTIGGIPHGIPLHGVRAFDAECPTPHSINGHGGVGGGVDVEVVGNRRGRDQTEGVFAQQVVGVGGIFESSAFAHRHLLHEITARDNTVFLPALEKLIERESAWVVEITVSVGNADDFRLRQTVTQDAGGVCADCAESLNQNGHFSGDGQRIKLRQGCETRHFLKQGL